MNWTESFFNKLYWELFMKRTSKEVNNEFLIIKSLLLEHKVSSFLDVCCGVGDIAQQFEKENIPVIGIDFSKDYIKESYIKNIIQGDACLMQTSEKFDVVINWFSSFSYFTPEKNKQLLTNCYNYCNKVFLLESYNSHAIISSFKEKLSYIKEYEGKSYYIQRLSRIEGKILYQKWIFNGIEFETQSYLYFPKEIDLLLKEIGFKKVELLGREDDRVVPFYEFVPRLIIRATK